MNYDTQSTVVRSRESALQTNKLLRNTYVLLAMTLGFSALTAGVSMVFNLPHPGIIITLIGYFGLTWDYPMVRRLLCRLWAQPGLSF